jgi:hypothetical protein
MDGRVKEVNRVVRGYDKYLFAQRERNGAIHVYRRTLNPADPMHSVFCLTDTWVASGRPVEWGLEVIVARLRAMDLWADETELDRIEQQQVIRDASKERHRHSSVEAFLHDFRKSFARATDGINTSGLKTDRRALKGA